MPTGYHQAQPRSHRIELLERLKELNQIGIALSRETDITSLLETIVVVAKRMSNADGATLYRVTDEHTLKFEIMRTNSLGIAMGGTTGIEIPFDQTGGNWSKDNRVTGLPRNDSRGFRRPMKSSVIL